ncbi:MAG: AAA family ATPase [Campylobacterota bacterium]|nr:AAA family ATPase [Campylobacterota bacterium]
MFQNSNKNQNNKVSDESSIDKNLKMMSVSAVVLIVLFGYTVIKSDSVIEGTSYYVGVIFLFVLLLLTFVLQKYKAKIRASIPKNKFQGELETAKEHSEDSNVKEKNDSSNIVFPITSNISFKDVAGISEVKEELEEVVDFLNNPKKYQKYDVSLPKGVLLVGPPGVGKTLIAKAVAGEADVPFFYQSGASFVHIYVGMGAKRVRELFMAAKAQAPSIIFIDEIDAVGKQRGLGSNDEREATLNELLTQMDGFDSKSGVMVIAATNKIEVLDEALLRAGRFDRRVFLSLPNKDDRLKILKLYLKEKRVDFDIEKLASDTSGFNSSALATLVNESVLNMIKREDGVVNSTDIETAKQKIQYGKKQIVLLSEDEKDILATYQAGKAFIAQEKVNLFDMEIENIHTLYPSRSQLEDYISKYLAGTIALKVMKDEEYVVNEKELKAAYDTATNMVEKYKMENNKDEIIDRLKNKLQILISSNVEEIEKIKNILLKDEVVF